MTVTASDTKHPAGVLLYGGMVGTVWVLYGTVWYFGHSSHLAFPLLTLRFRLLPRLKVFQQTLGLVAWLSLVAYDANSCTCTSRQRLQGCDDIILFIHVINTLAAAQV